MNDSIYSLLQAHVEQAVAPLFARSGRVRQMREELLAHLVNLFEEEFARHHDEQAALAAALCRFGDFTELQVALRASVPVRERLFYLILGNKETIMWRVFLIVGFLAGLVGMGFVCPALQQLRFQEVTPLAVVLLIFGSAVALGGLWSMVHGVKQARMRSS